VDEELWLVEEALLEVAKELPEDEKKHLKQLLEDSKKKHTKEILSIVERVARAFNPSANEERIQTVIQNAIKTSNLNKTAQQNEVDNKPETLKKEEHVEPPKVEVAPQAIPNPNIETLKKYLNLGIKLIPVYDSGAFVKEEKSSKPLRDWGTDNVGEIQRLINGYGYRNGIGRGSKISLFRLIPGDYGLVVIDILYTKAVNTAGSVKVGKGYRLIGSLGTIPILSETLKKLMLKEPVRMVPQPTKIVDFPYSSSTENGYLSDDEDPSAQVNETFLYCHKENKDYDIFDIANRLNGNDFKKGVADIRNKLKGN
jgi:hypothetical protein